MPRTCVGRSIQIIGEVRGETSITGHASHDFLTTASHKNPCILFLGDEHNFISWISRCCRQVSDRRYNALLSSCVLLPCAWFWSSHWAVGTSRASHAQRAYCASGLIIYSIYAEQIEANNEAWNPWFRYQLKVSGGDNAVQM